MPYNKGTKVFGAYFGSSANILHFVGFVVGEKRHKKLHTKGRIQVLGAGFKDFLFSSLLGEGSHFD